MFNCQHLSKQLTLTRISMVFAALVLPVLFAPFYADDFFHLLLLGESPLLQRGGDGSLFGLFSFVDSDPAHRAQLLRYGVLPWWSSDTFVMRFWRPLAEASHWLDYQLLPGVAWFAHLHSLLWFVLLAYVVYSLAKRREADKTVLLLVLALFLWDGQHLATIHWIANRSALISAVLAFSALFHQMCWREQGGAGHLLLALVLYLLALAASEMALSVLVYLFFYALLLDRQRAVAGLLHFIPYLLLSLGYLFFYHQAGFGAQTSEAFYISPLHEPLRFLQILPARFLAYSFAALVPVPAGLAWVGGATHAWLGQGFLLLALLLVPLLLWCLKSTFSDRRMAFWLLSGLLSCLPVCAAMPQDRLALYQTVGVDIYLAMFIGSCLRSDSLKNRLTRLLASGFIVLHLLLSPLYLLVGNWVMCQQAADILYQALHFNGQSSLERKHLVVINMPLGLSVPLIGTRAAMGADIPLSFLPLASDEGHFTLRRINEREFTVQRDTGFVIGFEQQFTAQKDRHFTQGQVFFHPAAQVMVAAVNDAGLPAVLQISLAAPPAAYQFYVFRPAAGLQPLQLPDVGAAIHF